MNILKVLCFGLFVGMCISTTQAHPKRGDCNCDGVVNYADIDPFVLIRTTFDPNDPNAFYSDPNSWVYQYPCNPFAAADINGDGIINNGATDPFVVDCMTGGCGEYDPNDPNISVYMVQLVNIQFTVDASYFDQDDDGDFDPPINIWPNPANIDPNHVWYDTNDPNNTNLVGDPNFLYFPQGFRLLANEAYSLNGEETLELMWDAMNNRDPNNHAMRVTQGKANELGLRQWAAIAGMKGANIAFERSYVVRDRLLDAFDAMFGSDPNDWPVDATFLNQITPPWMYMEPDYTSLDVYGTRS